MKNNHLVIMAGGIGSRFWPVSTPAKPKQFIDILGVGKTLIQLTVERFHGICPMENIWIVTSEAYRDIVKEQLPDLPMSNILLEPCMRNTAPCIAYVTWKIKKKNPNANIVVSPADHVILYKDEFKRVVLKGLEYTAGHNDILTLGIKPNRPETGYGYIKMLQSSSGPDTEIVKVDAFKEKPDRECAEEYLKAGIYLWNSGIFMWNVATIEKALRQYEPEIAALFDRIEAVFYSAQEQEIINKYFPECKNISIDYAVMERSDDIYVIPVDLGWSDVGTWGSLHELSEKDIDGNTIAGKGVRMVECKNCITHVSETTRIVLQGLEEYIIAENKGVFLICQKSQEQRIKEFSQKLHEI